MSLREYSVLIVDDSKRAREAVRLILDADPRFRVIAEAADGLQAVDRATQLMPDLILMDINMPKLNGLEATRMIKRALPYLVVVMLSVSDDAADLFEAIRHGAQGYLVKSLNPTHWIEYLHGILDGEAPVPRSMAQRLLAEFKMTGTATDAAMADVELLTSREREILALVATGATNRDIATRLFISENTVKNHLKNIMAKLHIQNRVQLAGLVKDSRSR